MAGAGSADDEAAPDRQSRLTMVAYLRTDLTLPELWLRYVALGGQAGRTELEHYLAGATQLQPIQRDMVSLAVNERLDELYPKAPFSADDLLAGDTGDTGDTGTTGGAQR